MKSRSLVFITLLFPFVFSCQKDNSDTDTPPTTSTPQEYFKLKTIKSTFQNPYGYPSSDSTSITIDSVNNKIIIKRYDSYKDTSIETYSYNSNNQLMLYEHQDTYDRLFISRMEFVRNNNGELTKVLSEYQHGLMAKSEGIVSYGKRGDTTLITFIDSAQKHPQMYSDAKDYYQVAIVNNIIPYYKYYREQVNGKPDSSIDKFSYDASGSITNRYYRYSSSDTFTTYTYQHGSQPATELQKFTKRLYGDLMWFYRAKLFGIDISSNYYLTGNILQSITQNNSPYMAYTNVFDTTNGNLKKTTYTIAINGYQTVREYEYWP